MSLLVRRPPAPPFQPRPGCERRPAMGVGSFGLIGDSIVLGGCQCVSKYSGGVERGVDRVLC